MATIVKTPSGTWKAVIRKTGFPTTVKTFRPKKDAEDWARRTKDEMVRGFFVQRAPAERLTFDKAMQRHLAEVTPTKRPMTQSGERERSVPLIDFSANTPLQPSRRNCRAAPDKRLAGDDRKDDGGKSIARASNNYTVMSRPVPLRKILAAKVPRP